MCVLCMFACTVTGVHPAFPVCGCCLNGGLQRAKLKLGKGKQAVPHRRGNTCYYRGRLSVNLARHTHADTRPHNTHTGMSVFEDQAWECLRPLTLTFLKCSHFPNSKLKLALSEIDVHNPQSCFDKNTTLLYHKSIAQGTPNGPKPVPCTSLHSTLCCNPSTNTTATTWNHRCWNSWLWWAF